MSSFQFSKSDAQKENGDKPNPNGSTLSLLVFPKKLTSPTKPKIVQLKLESTSVPTLMASACTPCSHLCHPTRCTESDIICSELSSSDFENCNLNLDLYQAANICTTGTSTGDDSESYTGNQCGCVRCKCVCHNKPWCDIEVPLKKEKPLPECPLKPNPSNVCEEKKCKEDQKNTCNEGKSTMIFQIIYYGLVIPFLIIMAIWISKKSNEEHLFRIFGYFE